MAMNPFATDQIAGGLLAAAERASRRAPRMLSHALSDLALGDGHRLSDEVRATWQLLLTNAIDEVERGLRERIAKKLDVNNGDAALVEVIARPHSLVRDVLDRAHFPDQPDLSAALLEQAANIVLRRNLSSRARRSGEYDPVRKLSGDQSEAGHWATALLLAQSISEGPEAAPVLAAEQQHSLVWAVAAALRVVLVSQVLDIDSLDQIVSDSASALLAGHEEIRAVEVIASRLTLVVGEHISAPAALIAGYPELSAVLLSQKTGIDRHSISAIQLESDCARLALLMKAADVERDIAAKLFVALAEVRRSDVPIAELIAGYEALDAEDARRALSSLRLDPGYARVVSLYSGNAQ